MYASCHSVVAVLCLISLSSSQIIRDTEYGRVEGNLVVDVFNGETYSNVNSFYAVPYGDTTAGQNRFAKPLKSPAYAVDPLDCKVPGTQCPQRKNGVLDNTHPGWDDYGEDCLNVNIFSPDTPGSYPVMVWLYGGAFTSGANIMYPGHFLATRGVVVVVVNWRINHFGFAYTGTAESGLDAAPGNMGLWDQKMSLEFVRDNIANFYGDPGRVTIFGQSAGAASVGHQIISPQGQDLFHQAILESGTESNFWSMNYPEAEPETFIWEVADRLNCTEGGDPFLMIDCLRLLPWEDVRGTGFRCTPGHFCQGMAPVVDGPGGYLPEKPRDLRASGDIMQGPIITGLCKDDGSMYTIGMIPETVFGGFNRTMFLHYLRNRLVSIWEPLFDNVTAENVFRAVDYNYTPWPYVEAHHDNREAFNKMITDAAFGFPWDRQLKDHKQYADVYGYIYDYRGRNGTQYFAEWMGVPHQGELPQVWGWPLLTVNPQVRNDSLIYHDMIDWTDEDINQTIFWETLYSNFATTGNPTPEPVTSPLGDEITWRPFTEEDMAFIYVNNVTIDVPSLYEQKDYAFWGEYLQKHIVKGIPIPFYNSDVDGFQAYQRKKAYTDQHKAIPSTWMEDAWTTFADMVNDMRESGLSWDDIQ